MFKIKNKSTRVITIAVLMLWQLLLTAIVPLAYAKPEVLHPLGLVNLPGNGNIHRKSIASDKASKIIKANNIKPINNPHNVMPSHPGFHRLKLKHMTPAQAYALLLKRKLPKNINHPANANSLMLKPKTLNKTSSPISSKTLTKTSGKTSGKTSSNTSPTGLHTTASLPTTPGSIAELARALTKNTVNDEGIQNIFQYVYNNIAYTPVYGVQRGAFGALMDGEGNDFDQSELMVALLSQAGYSASFVLGDIQLTPAQVASWLNTDNSKATNIQTLLDNGGIPNNVTANSDGSLNNVVLSHMWVQVVDGSNTYVFDPSFKSYNYTTGINLASAMNFNLASFISDAEVGMSSSTSPTSIQNVNRSNIRNDLKTYAVNLINWIRTNSPSASLKDIIGGKTLNKVTTPQHNTALAYQESGTTPTVYPTMPDSYRMTFEIQFQGINETYYADDIYGQRLTLFFNSSNQPILYLAGVAQGSPGTAISPGSYNPITLTVTTSYYQFADSQYINSTNPYFLGNSWGTSSRQMIEYHRQILAINRLGGNSDSSEPVLGESLAMYWYTHSSENRTANDLIDQLNNCTTVYFQGVGLIGYVNTPAFDIAGTVSTCTSLNGVTANADTVFMNASIHASAFESAVIQQMAKIVAIDTPKVIDAENTSSALIFNANSSNWNNTPPPPNVQSYLSNYSASAISNINSDISNGDTVVLPQFGNETINSWVGTAYYVLGTNNIIGTEIDGGLNGGNGTEPQTPKQVNDGAQNNQPEQGSANNPFMPISISNEPIDLFTGNYLYAHQDLSVGSASFPYGLALNRFYVSGQSSQIGAFGNGWTHNYTISIQNNSDGYQGMGEDSAIDAAGSIAEIYTTSNILADPNFKTNSLTDLTFSALCNSWFIDNLTLNTEIVNLPNNTQVYVLLPDGSYNPPPANANKLQLVNNLFTLKTPQNISWNFNANGNVSSWSNANGISLTYNYNTSNLLTTVSNTLGKSLTFSYNASNLVSSITDNTGRSVSYTYTGNNLTGFTNALGNTTTFAYDSNNRLTSYYLPANLLKAFVTNVYDSLGRVETQTDATGNQWTYYFGGYRIEEVDPNGNSKVKFFNSLGKAYRDINQLGQEIDNVYDGLNRLVQTTLPLGNSTTFTYDNNNNVLSTVAAPVPGSTLSPMTNTCTYNPIWNKVASFTDGLGNTTTFTYDSSLGNLLQVTKPVVNSQTPIIIYTYNNIGQVLTATDETGIIAQYNYDAITGNLLSVIHDYGTSPHLNLTTTFTYDNVGNLLTVTDPNGNTTNNSYDALRRLTNVIAPDSAQSGFGYDANNNLLTKTNQINSSTTQTYTYTYNYSNQLVTSIDPSSNTTTLTYDNLRRLLTSKDPKGNVTTYAYDPVSRISTITNANSVIEETKTYTANGLLASVADANSNSTTYTYDGFDRLAVKTFPDSTTQNYTYDANSNILSLITRIGNSITYTYDTLNRLTSKAPQSEATVSYTYDLASRPLTTSTPVVANDPSTGSFSFAYDSAGRLISETTPDSKVVQYTLDNNSNTIKLTYPDSYYVNYSYDGLNRLTNLYLNGSTTSAASYVYDDASRLTNLSLGNGANSNYTYQANDDLTGLTHNFNTSNSVTWTLGYDANSQLTDSNVSNSAFMWHPSAGGTVAYSGINNLNQYGSVGSIPLLYDKSGNLLINGNRVFSYDTQNQLTQAINGTAIVNFEYDPLMRQTIKKVTGGNNTRFLYSGSEQIADYDMSTGSLLNHYIYGNDLVATVDASGNVTYNHEDKSGSIIATTNASGTVTNEYSYSPFGESSNFTLSGFGYTGQRYDSELGLYNYKARYYNPSLGRFLQPDPIGYASGLNLYTYVDNDPLDLRDPSGRTANSGGQPLQWIAPILDTVFAPILSGSITRTILQGSTQINTGCGGTNVGGEGSSDTPGISGGATIIFPPNISPMTPTPPSGVTPPGDNTPNPPSNPPQENQEPGKYPPIPTDPTQPPEPTGWEWRGKEPVGGDKGGWFKPETGESMHPDLNHKPPKGSHWDYTKRPNDSIPLDLNGNVIPE